MGIYRVFLFDQVSVDRDYFLLIEIIGIFSKKYKKIILETI